VLKDRLEVFDMVLEGRWIKGQKELGVISIKVVISRK
jgi:hypothetical protein